jgi:predicted translin family RNA/ssDNA-binding protein
MYKHFSLYIRLLGTYYILVVNNLSRSSTVREGIIKVSRKIHHENKNLVEKMKSQIQKEKAKRRLLEKEYRRIKNKIRSITLKCKE